MKKIAFVILSFSFLFIIGTTYWITEATSINPFAKLKLPKAESQLLMSYEPGYYDSALLQSKADSIVNNAILMYDFIGVSAGMYKDSLGIYIANAGFADKRSKKRPSAQTLFRTASIAKPMTAVAIMQMYEKGQIDLDVAIQTYLPEFPIKEQGTITIRQLLSHTSGIRHYKSTWDGISFTEYESLIDALDEFKNDTLLFTPGSAYKYSTYGYTVLGAIIEKLSGQSFQSHMKESIFSKAGMFDTNIEEANSAYVDKASLYIKLGNSYIKSPKTDLSVKSPGGGFHTTAKDLLLFGKAILNHTLIDSSSLAMMINVSNNLKEGFPYGFGWFVVEDNGMTTLQHGGSQSGTSSDFRILLDKGIVAVALSNSFGSDEGVGIVAKDLSNLLTDESNLRHAVNYFKKQPTENLERFVGSYEFEDDVFIISKKGDQLFSQLNQYPSLAIYPKSSNTFFYRMIGGDLIFGVKDGIRFIKFRDLTCFKK